MGWHKTHIDKKILIVVVVSFFTQHAVILRYEGSLRNMEEGWRNDVVKGYVHHTNVGGVVPVPME